MNREIKFRAWDIKKEKMLGWDMGIEIYQDGVRILDDEGGIHHPEVHLMQYTGLKDKNGKDIYERDIVKEFDTNCIREISWRDDLGCWNIGRYKDGEVFDMTSYEIIGNIYENPELLDNK